MATTVCPNCKILLRKGSWELLTHCPECKTPWNVAPDANERNSRKVQIRAVLYTLLSFVPILGLLFGALGVFWGYLAIKFRHVTLGVTLMLVSGALLVCNSALAWWGIGQYADRQCHATMETVAGSIRAYHDNFQVYPDSLPDLGKAKLPTAKGCIYGGTYFYLPPWGWQQTEIASGEPEAEWVGLKKEPVVSIPAASAKLPEKWATSMPASWQPTFYAAELPMTNRRQPEAHSGKADLSTSIMVGEVKPVHRYLRLCIMADMSVREMSPEEYEKLLKLPQNQVFAKLVEGARKLDEDSAVKKSADKSFEATMKSWKATTHAATQNATNPATATSPSATSPSTVPGTAPAEQGDSR